MLSSNPKSAQGVKEGIKSSFYNKDLIYITSLNLHLKPKFTSDKFWYEINDN